MKRFLFLIAFLAMFVYRVDAQTQTLVSGTLVDPNGIPYYPATVTACLSPATFNPTVGGRAVNPNAGANYCVPATTTSVTGFFSVALWGNALITPGSTTWVFSVAATGTGPPAGNGPLNFSSAGVTISGATQDVSANINSVGTAQLKSSGGTGGLTTPTSTLPEQANLLAAYWIQNGENPCALTDYSNHGNGAIGCPAGTPNLPAVSGGISAGGISCSATSPGTPVKLPASLRSSVGGPQTYVFLIRPHNTTFPNIVQALVSGNGNGALGHTFGLLVDHTQFVEPNMNAGWGINTAASTTGANPLYQTVTSASAFGQYIVVTFVLNDPLHSNQDAIYVNGNFVPGNTAGTSLGADSVGNLQLCGTPANSGFNTDQFYDGEIHFFGVWKGTFTYADHFAVNQVVREAKRLSGLADLNCSWFDASCAPFPGFVNIGKSSDAFHEDGDSICAQGDGLAFNPVARGGASLLISQSCLISQPLATVASDAENLFTSYFLKNNVRNTEQVEGSYDDAGVTADQVGGMFWSICRVAVKYNVKCIPETRHSVTSDAADLIKNAANAVLLGNLGSTIFPDVSNTAAVSELGADHAWANATNFPDTVHPAAFLQENYRMPLKQAAYNRTWTNNNSWANAAVHSSSEPAAVATTAGTQSGNIMTITMTATPASCVKGNFAFITGTTAATIAGAYNSDRAAGRPVAWYIRTSTATQITFYSGQTGAGSITAQGTITCSSFQDFEVYVTATFGAGNMNLPPCEVWAGHSIYLKNNSAGAITLVVPWSGETIDNNTVAANSQAKITSLQGTLSASGCKWVTTF